VRARWLSARALRLHLLLLVVVTSCLVAWWWQVTRALGGNDLSYLYAVEWPVFAVVAVVGWWILVHTDPETTGARGMRRAAEAQAAPVDAAPPRRLDEEDEALAAYNDRLARLAGEGPKTWRRPEAPVVRRDP
jgi:hypothetical protein